MGQGQSNTSEINGLNKTQGVPIDQIGLVKAADPMQVGVKTVSMNPMQAKLVTPTTGSTQKCNIDEDATLNIDLNINTKDNTSNTTIRVKGESVVFKINRNSGDGIISAKGNISVALIPVPNIMGGNINKSNPVYFTNGRDIETNIKFSSGDFDWMGFAVVGRKEGFGNVEETHKKNGHNYALYMILILILVLVIGYLNRDKLRKLVN